MKEKKKLRLKKFYLHPVTTFIILILVTVLLSGLFSLFEMQATYSRINPNTNQLESVLVAVENLCNYDGLKYIISNAARNFVSFTTLSTLLIALIGLSVAQSSGLIDAFIKRVLVKLDNKKVTFLLLFLATISSIINDVGYVILIPLGALVFLANKRNPLAGIITSFCGVAFGYGATIFVGSMEVNLITSTESAARLIDSSFHVSLTSNLFIIIVTTFVLSFIGTVIIEKIIIPRLGRYHDRGENFKTEEIEKINVEEEEQKKLEEEIREKKGLRNAFITALVILGLFIYMIIPNLPFSGILLDMEETSYLGQLFGTNSYFQDGFTYMISLFFLITGIAYGIGAKTFKSDHDIIEGSTKYMTEIASLIALIFFAAQFIAIFRKTNIGTIVTAWIGNMINGASFTGIPLVLLVLVGIALAGFLAPTPVAKWTILSPVIVPKLMQANIAPQFSQFLLRAGDSMTKGITPLLAYFVLFIGYLNIYNPKKEKPITIGAAIKMIMPYCFIMMITWILLSLLWYITGLPLGPNVNPTI